MVVLRSDRALFDYHIKQTVFVYPLASGRFAASNEWWVTSRSSLSQQRWASAEHGLLPGENEDIWQVKVTWGLCLYPGPENTAIKHFVITLYINAQQSGATFPPASSGCLVSLDFLLAPFQIKWVPWKSALVLLNPKEVLFSPYWQVKSVLVASVVGCRGRSDVNMRKW